KPQLLMIDEMSLGLAPVVVEQLMEVLSTIRDEGVTVLLVEQDIHLALSGADRGYVMETGSIVHSGDAKALIDDPAVRKAYLGLCPVHSPQSESFSGPAAIAPRESAENAQSRWL